MHFTLRNLEREGLVCRKVYAEVPPQGEYFIGEPAGSRLGPDLAAVPQLDDPIAIIAAMWNHAARMEEESRKLGVLWPRFQPGDTADLAAFLIEKRSQQPRPAARAQR